MAKVKIQGHASGTGILTVTAPDTDVNRTITLPDGTGTLAFTTGDDDKLPLAGGTMTGNIDHDDGVRARYGDDNDLQIFHVDGSNSYIENVGEGDLIIQDIDGDVRIKGKSNEDSIVANNDGSVQLYYDNGIKLATTTTGIDVTGSVTADSLTVGEAGSDYAIMIKEGSGGEYYQLGVDSYGGLVFYNETSKVAEFTDASTFITQGDTTVNGNITCNQPDNGGSPAMTATIDMHGYEGRGVGIKMKDSVNSASGASDREWFVGTGYNYSGFNIGYSSTGSESSYSAQTKLRVSSGGDVQVDTGNLVIGTAGKGIDFSAQTASTSGTTTAELLDHYEEGTWTPVFNNADTAAGTYTKIGNFVFCTGKISTSGGTAGSAITGMPFAPMGGTGERGGGSVIYQSHESYAWNAIVNDSSQVTFYKGASGMTDLADGVACYFEISYRTTA
jgi:hypothetical protein